MSKTVVSFVCSNCGTQYAKWSGKCESCDAWNSLEKIDITLVKNISKKASNTMLSSIKKISFADLSAEIEMIPRYMSGIAEFDRACGGGLVSGSAILVGGEPGIGKSTLLMQVVANLSQNYPCIYISGEESLDQLKRRAIRLNVSTANLRISNSTSVEEILYNLETMKDTKILIIDSIQTMVVESVGTTAGTVSQVRSSAHELTNFCKKNNIALIMIGHVTREGQIAGPKVLEHMVDCVLYFEGEKNNNFRILRAVKNRFGPTDEIGIFEMIESGLQEVSNPSSLFLHDYKSNISGTAVFASVEGLRPVLVEVQALLVPTVFASPRRAIVGADLNRLSMITAVLEARSGVLLSNKDVYLNIAGGLKIDEPSLDLAICAALVSTFLDKPIKSGTVFFGELSLSGQIRGISHIEKRLSESMRLGFTKAIMPSITKKQKVLIKKDVLDNIEIIEISNINELSTLIRNFK